MDVDDLEVSVRTYNALKNKGFKTVEEVVQTPLKELLRTKNFGIKSLADLVIAIQERGYIFEDIGLVEAAEEEDWRAKIRYVQCSLRQFLQLIARQKRNKRNIEQQLRSGRAYAILELWVQGQTLEEIGEQFNISGARVGQIRSKICRILRHPRSEHLREPLSPTMIRYVMERTISLLCPVCVHSFDSENPRRKYCSNHCAARGYRERNTSRS